jgi:putative oxidoreductase
MATQALDSFAVSDRSGAVPLVGRLMIALIFLLSGASKLAAPAATLGYIAFAGLPLPQAGLVIAILVEIGGGLALALGWRTRVAALVLAAFSVAAALAFHHHFTDQNQMIHFLKNIAMAGGLLFVAQAGAGRISLDGRAGR